MVFLNNKLTNSTTRITILLYFYLFFEEILVFNGIKVLCDFSLNSVKIKNLI